MGSAVAWPLSREMARVCSSTLVVASVMVRLSVMIIIDVVVVCVEYGVE